MAIQTALRKYMSMAAFEGEKSTLPYPCVAFIIDTDGKRYVFFRHALSDMDDSLYEIGVGDIPVIPDEPVIPPSGGDEEPETPPSGGEEGGETPDEPDTPVAPDEPTGYDFEISGPTEIFRKDGNVYYYTTSNAGGSIVASCEWLYVEVEVTSPTSFKITVNDTSENDLSKPVEVTVSCGDVIRTLLLTVKGYKDTTTGKDFGSKKSGYVDLGLPSGTLWASTNIGVSGNYYEQPGGFYAWGETKAKTSFSKSGYANEKLVSLPQTKDVVNATYGGDWRMPTIDDINELILNTDVESTTFLGSPVLKFTSKLNERVLYIPRAGYYQSDTAVDTDNTYIWANGASSRNTATKLYAMSAALLGFSTSYYPGWYGMNVRGVI